MNQIVCEKRSYGSRALQHAHDYNQLILPLTGSLHLKLNKEERSLSKDQFCFLSSGLEHGFRAEGANQFAVLDIPKWMVPVDGHSSSYRIDQAMDARWDAVRSLVLAEISTGRKGKLSALVDYIWSMMETESELKSITYMKENLSEPITMKELAMVENYHPSYFPEWFHRKTGLAPRDYLQRLRLQRAKELLEETNDSLLQIALAVGYEKQSSLTRLFKRLEGVSPRAYRKRIRNSAK
jgi:AraC-like DNA-binding protein